MGAWWNSSIPQLTLWGTVLLLMLAVAFSVLRRLRDSTVGDQHHPKEMLVKFQEMRVQGDINDSEYRTIQSLLKTQPPTKEKDTQHNA